MLKNSFSPRLLKSLLIPGDEPIMHRLRVLSAVILVLPFLLLVHYGSPLHFRLLMSVAILLCAWEFAWLCPAGGSGVAAILTVMGSLAWQWSAIAGVTPAVVPPVVAAGMLAWAVVGRGEFRVDAVRAAWVVLGVAYVGALLTYGGLLRDLPDGRQLITFVAFTTWAGDIGAYYVGSRWGRRALAPRVSPKKTVEGMLGGIAASVIVGGAGSVWLWPLLSPGSALWIAGVLALVGILGDLAESVVKRAAGVKDSGASIPGHGGVLDRLDSLIFAAPALYAMVRLGWV